MIQGDNQGPISLSSGGSSQVGINSVAFGSPYYYSQAPRQMMQSVISSGTLLAGSDWAAVVSSDSGNFLEITEILVYPWTGASGYFGIAIANSGVTGTSFDQAGVIVKHLIPNAVTGDLYSKICVNLALTKGDQLYLISTVKANYYVSGKFVTT